jgi:hypothetical protein
VARRLTPSCLQRPEFRAARIVVPTGSGHDARVDYAEARTTFLCAPTEDRPAPQLPDSPALRLRDAAEPIATISFWSPAVNERFAALGLNFLTGYVWGRSAPMGEPTPPVVAAAFAVFEPGLIAGLYEGARGAASRNDVLAAREEGTVATLAELLPEADVAPAVALLRRAVDAVAVDVAGRPLFAGLLSLPWPSDLRAQLWHAATLLREYRGDVHVNACVAAGLTGVQMNLMTESWIGWAPTSYTATRGWSAEAMAEADADLVARGLSKDGRLTEDGRRLRDAVEAQTDAALARAIAAVRTDLPALTEQLDAWAALVVAGGAAPLDPYKRVSG